LKTLYRKSKHTFCIKQLFSENFSFVRWCEKTW